MAFSVYCNCRRKKSKLKTPVQYFYLIYQGASDYISKSGLSEFPQVLLNGVPMKEKYLTGDTFEEGVVQEIMTQTPDIQKAVYQVQFVKKNHCCCGTFKNILVYFDS